MPKSSRLNQGLSAGDLAEGIVYRLLCGAQNRRDILAESAPACRREVGVAFVDERVCYASAPNFCACGLRSLGEIYFVVFFKLEAAQAAETNTNYMMDSDLYVV